MVFSTLLPTWCLDWKFEFESTVPEGVTAHLGQPPQLDEPPQLVRAQRIAAAPRVKMGAKRRAASRVAKIRYMCLGMFGGCDTLTQCWGGCGGAKYWFVPAG